MSHSQLSPGRGGVGLRNVGSYQISGQPFVSGSTLLNGEEKCISFPGVSKSITVIASGSGGDPLIGVSFTSLSASATVKTNHRITMDSNGDSMTFDAKCKEIWVHAENETSGFQLYVSLTSVPPERMYELTGSGFTD